MLVIASILAFFVWKKLLKDKFGKVHCLIEDGISTLEEKSGKKIGQAAIDPKKNSEICEQLESEIQENPNFENSVSIQIDDDGSIKVTDSCGQEIQIGLDKDDKGTISSTDDGQTLTTADGSGDSENFENPIGPVDTIAVEEVCE